ncbi:SusC/RagA family TonB-linked outer membrane protein [Persicobacter diffluens]|uniref:SusC/RagA family TonB-linked outer membrane protein n=1 Tax=Persicobacter diffluens TaxID=981 RepID=A0AAN5ANP4_9BACT|nr:SusC/RagA family TonB-linked outer membrane protein [Persicobacter diffluens]
MVPIRLLFWCLLLLSPMATLAQGITVKGQVTDTADNSGLPGVNITVVGSSHGTVTDFNGDYSIVVPSAEAELQFSFIGYSTLAEKVGNRTTINATLSPEVTQLNDVVVTALGIEREERSLGYAVSELKAEEMGVTAANPSVMNSLQGKVAGVQISPVTGGPGSSASVVIRGNAVLGGSNQPLYVIDGVPMSNNQLQSADDKDNGGTDSGNGLTGINPEDIATMSVLKGPAATALYGSRAINGVVLITTKKGSNTKGWGIDFNSAVTVDVMGITPDQQTAYAHGTRGELPTSSNAKSTTSMWGPKIAGHAPTDAYYDGKMRTLQTYDNYDNFFRNGVSFNNSIALTTGNETSSLRFSYGNFTNDGMVENSAYDRNSFNLRGTTKMINDKLTLDSRVTYVNEKAHNRMEMGNSVNNYMGMMLGIPNTYSTDWMKDYKNPNTGLPMGYNEKEINPYWYTNEVKNEDESNRIMGMLSATYQITDDLSVLARGGRDFKAFRQNVLQPIGTPYYEQGRAYERTSLELEDNFDLMLTYHKQFGDFDITSNIGTSYMHQFREYTDVGSSEFPSDILQNPEAGASKFAAFSTYERAISSVFGTASIGYKGYLFLDVTARNDWSSTLPMNNNSYFYPSVSGSWVFSDMDWTMPSWLSFGKLRASWAQVGSDTDPYQLALQYELDAWNHPNGNGFINVGGIQGSDIRNANLKPAISTSYEFGFDLRMFDNRLTIDAAYYKQSAVDQILNVDVSDASGYASAWINAGEITNQGVELMVSGTPIQTQNFTWETTVNASYNQNEVISLTEGVPQYMLLPTSGSVSVQAIPGQAYGAIVGKTAKRDPNGNYVVTAGDNGEVRMVANDENEVIGNGVQPWMVGWRNTFTYKNFSVSALIDAKFGGDIYSNTNASMYSMGKHEATLVGRDAYYNTGMWNPGNLVIENGDGTYSAFNGSVDPEQYYGSMAGISEFHMYDASFIKLRELSITYRLPNRLIEKTPFKNLSVSAIGTNLGYLWTKTENIDPEASFTSGNGQGIESTNMAIPRTFGFKLNANF